jgi:DNA recombination protein RmuC
MFAVLGCTVLAFLIVNTILLWILLRNNSNNDSTLLVQSIRSAHAEQQRSIQEEFLRNRSEVTVAARDNRQEILGSFATFSGSVFTHITEFRTELTTAFNGLSGGLDNRLGETIRTQGEQLKASSSTISATVANSAQVISESLEQLRSSLGQQFSSIQRETSEKLELIRNTTEGKLSNVTATLAQSIESLTTKTGESAEKIKLMVEAKLGAIENNNSVKLEQMRVTVDEKLHATLEQRLGENFRLVSERLEEVHKGLGEMRSLASGVGDLKKVMMNVRARGTWGEIQLGALLEQMLTPDQYSANVFTSPDSNERVEYAIKLPGRDGTHEPIWLPIDSKFPKQDYERLIDASERGDAAGMEQCGKDLEENICAEAKKIHDKYVRPPHTLDFAILFLPTESLFAEILRRPGMYDRVLSHRVVIAGPTTLAALLNSLQMGFRTLAIEKRSGEVWKILGAVKSEFSKFGDALGAVEKKLTEASTKLGNVRTRSNVLKRKLTDVEELPDTESAEVLKVDSFVITNEEDGERVAFTSGNGDGPET